MHIRDVLNFPILQQFYDLYKLCYQYRFRISKAHRYGLWQRCESMILSAIEAILHGAHLSDADRKKSLQRVNVRLDMLRMLFRLAFDLHIIEETAHARLQVHLNTTGRMVGGWIKSIP